MGNRSTLKRDNICNTEHFFLNILFVGEEYVVGILIILIIIYYEIK